MVLCPWALGAWSVGVPRPLGHAADQGPWTTGRTKEQRTKNKGPQGPLGCESNGVHRPPWQEWRGLARHPRLM
jgi:hypothetical protein